MVHEVQMGTRKRMSFSRINEVLDMPDLIEVQKNSYQRFVDEDLREVLDDISPITDYTEKLVLEFVDYKIDFDHPKYSVEECKERDVNYCAPLKVLVRLINKETGEVKEQPVFMGDFPLMTEQGLRCLLPLAMATLQQLQDSEHCPHREHLPQDFCLLHYR